MPLQELTLSNLCTYYYNERKKRTINIILRLPSKIINLYVFFECPIIEIVVLINNSNYYDYRDLFLIDYLHIYMNYTDTYIAGAPLDFSTQRNPQYIDHIHPIMNGASKICKTPIKRQSKLHPTTPHIIVPTPGAKMFIIKIIHANRQFM